MDAHQLAAGKLVSVVNGVDEVLSAHAKLAATVQAQERGHAHAGSGGLGVHQGQLPQRLGREGARAKAQGLAHVLGLLAHAGVDDARGVHAVALADGQLAGATDLKRVAMRQGRGNQEGVCLNRVAEVDLGPPDLSHGVQASAKGLRIEDVGWRAQLGCAGEKLLVGHDYLPIPSSALRSILPFLVSGIWSTRRTWLGSM